MTKEYKVMKDGELWSNRFDSIEEAQLHVDECFKKYGGEYEISLMTEEEIEAYIK